MPETQPSLLEVNVVGETAVVRFTQKNFSDLNPQLVGKQLVELVEAVGQHWVFIDFDNVEFLASIGLAKLVTLHKQIQAKGGRLTVVNVRDNVYQAFEITRLTNVLDIRRREGEAGSPFVPPV